MGRKELGREVSAMEMYECVAVSVPTILPLLSV